MRIVYLFMQLMLLYRSISHIKYIHTITQDLPCKKEVYYPFLFSKTICIIMLLFCILINVNNCVDILNS